MHLGLIFVGRIFKEHTALHGYVVRHFESEGLDIASIAYFEEGDNHLFLGLELALRHAQQLVIIATPKSFSLVGKLLSTLMGDNQILKEGMLLPSKTQLFAPNSYLVEHAGVPINVLSVDWAQNMPQLLLQSQTPQALLHIFDVSIEDVMLLLQPLAQSYDVRIVAVPFVQEWVHLHIDAQKHGQIKHFIGAVKALLEHKVIASNRIIAYIIERLRGQNSKISFAESCTGGLLASLFTAHSGVSDVFDGSIVSYSNRLKNAWLGIEERLFIEHGAVSSEVVAAMSREICHVADAQYAIAISGIAGPSGAVEGKPVGTVYVSVKSPHTHLWTRLQLAGDREYIQYQSAFYGVKMLLQSDKALFFDNR
ncbi:MAG: hypothetical protein KU37_05085 [Sulfuricurvum sp. PC08-66]|nr:MAG: hypothetical protein KU37_05085 [Sulfuricurvum sp. PC08-66]